MNMVVKHMTDYGDNSYYIYIINNYERKNKQRNLNSSRLDNTIFERIEHPLIEKRRDTIILLIYDLLLHDAKISITIIPFKMIICQYNDSLT